MNPCIKIEDEKEFDEILDLAQGLFSRRKTKRESAVNELVRLGTKAVRPLVATIEYAIWDHDMSDDEINAHAERVSEVILKIGKDALPYLEDFATSEECNLYVNEWAQDMIFRVMGLEGVERQKVCHHAQRILLTRKKRKIRVCISCEAEFEETENDKIEK